MAISEMKDAIIGPREDRRPSAMSGSASANRRVHCAVRLSLFALLLSLLSAPRLCAEPPAEPKPGPVSDVDAFLGELERALSGAKTIVSEYRQERVLDLFDEPLITSGVMAFERPTRVRWETAEPYHSALLADGKSVAQFEWIDGQRKRMSLGYPEGLRRMMEEIAAMNQGRLRDRAPHFNIRAFKGEAARIEMEPKDAGMREHIAAIEIEFAADFSATRQIVLREPNGDLTRIVILAERRNVSLPEKAFDLSDPSPLDGLRAAAASQAEKK